MTIVVIATSINVALLLTYSESRIQAYGSIKTVGVEAYWDIGCSDRVTDIDWGLIEPGSQVETMFYVKNQGNAPITLSLNVNSWNPSEAQNHLNLTWDYSGSPIDPSASIPVFITLAVSQDITGITAFSFQIIISAQG